MIPDRIIKTRRKTISLQITEYAELIVRAPYRVKEKEIEEVIRKHNDWIRKKKQEMLSKDPKFARKQFVNGEGFLYLGKNYKLRIVDGGSDRLTLQDQFILPSDSLHRARDIFLDWYHNAALIKLTERADVISQSTGLKYYSIKITNAEKRWGSCGTKGRLNFSWRLAMAPVSVIDYVVLHELVHTAVKNHQRSFWNRVEAFMPDYRKKNEWLKQNGYLLRL